MLPDSMRIMNALPPAPGTEEHVSLALVNTVVTLPIEEIEDSLASPEDSTRWLIAHQLVPDDTQLLPYCQSQLTGLRVQLRALFTAKVKDTPPATGLLDSVNHSMQKISSAPELQYDPRQGFYRRHMHPVTQLVEHAMALISDDAAELLTGERAGSLAQCESAPCDRFYVRTHARRRWCSTRCGDRVRAARAYARKQQTTTSAG